MLAYLARAHVKHGQPSQAYSALQRALHANPTDLALRFNIAVTIERMAVVELRRSGHTSKDIHIAMGRLKCE